MKYAKAFWDGVASCFDLSGTAFQPEIEPWPTVKRIGIRSDYDALRSDWGAVGNDMRKVMEDLEKIWTPT